MDGWKTIVSFWDGLFSGKFQGQTVSFGERINFLCDCLTWSISFHLPILLGRGGQPKAYLDRITLSWYGINELEFLSPGVSSCYATILLFSCGWS